MRGVVENVTAPVDGLVSARELLLVETGGPGEDFETLTRQYMLAHLKAELQIGDTKRPIVPVTKLPPLKLLAILEQIWVISVGLLFLELPLSPVHAYSRR